MDRHIATQKPPVYPPKRPQKGTQPGPHPFTGVGMDLAHPIAVIVACPFALPMADRRMWPRDVVVTVVLIGVDMGSCPRELVDMRAQRAALCIAHHPQAHLPRFAARRVGRV